MEKTEASPTQCVAGWEEAFPPGISVYDGEVGTASWWCDSTPYGACAPGPGGEVGGHDPSVKGSVTNCCYINHTDTLGFLRVCDPGSSTGPDSPVTNLGSEYQLCTSNVTQPACYNISRPTPTFRWTFNSSDSDPNDGLGAASQISYWVQVDNNGSLANGNFPSPEIDTREISSGNKAFTAPNDGTNGLQFNTVYRWKVAIKDNYNTWSGWTCADTTFMTNGPCNIPPTATNLQVAKGNYCSSPSHHFSWRYSDPDNDTQSRYQFQVDNNAGFSSPEVDRNYYSLSNPSPTTNNQTVVVAVSPTSDQIAYNTTYYWRVKVYDSEGDDSGWVSGSSFATDRHMWPTIDFNWMPTSPSQDEEALFADLSTVYGGSTKSSWFWSFENGNPFNSSLQSPIVKFVSTGDKQITLQVTDSDSYSCTGSKTINVQSALPGWEER